MHAQQVVEALQAQFGGVSERVSDSDWELRCRALKRGNDAASLEVLLRGYPGSAQVHLATVDARPSGLGLGTKAMEALAAFCRPRGIVIDLHALESSVEFFRRFEWLREVEPGSRNFESTW